MNIVRVITMFNFPKRPWVLNPNLKNTHLCIHKRLLKNQLFIMKKVPSTKHTPNPPMPHLCPCHAVWKVFLYWIMLHTQLTISQCGKAPVECLQLSTPRQQTHKLTPISHQFKTKFRSISNQYQSLDLSHLGCNNPLMTSCSQVDAEADIEAPVLC